ncbi:TPA: phosphotyrosine protein phosphatase [Candidatus Woesearchaeota archaeon]|nr:phosphotyrosine protein phosphatase [Candidatus Woesearchaeota archaeon]HIH31431.1 phosphotyrosine protein phosphatase [Candidatus Woesearchaeota archaeon]HIH55308.1 phosphotyrosine protein phosphatase [Candidatus Woesearchaeota archaeon]HIJ01285.1 phosphotyrosine protein phosphatase [Candidatus Woesearchaeota archaeon]HIJ13690.1 phosphotyrosine protein phosphatase [Candidatus Woesearchaeota archaeon]
MNILFVCNQGQNRSRTAEFLFRDRFNTKSAGLFNNLLTEKQLKWADMVFVMEEFQRTEISKRFQKEYLKKRIINLDIPDTYYFNQPELVDLLKVKVDQAIHEIAV